MAKTYDSTAPRRGDTNLILLEKMVQKLGGTYKYGETENSLLTKVLTLLPTAPKIYRATLQQEGGAQAPYAQILENSFGAVPQWVYVSPGIYDLELAAAFPVFRTFVQIEASLGAQAGNFFWRSSIIDFGVTPPWPGNAIRIESDVKQDGGLIKTAFQVLVYPAALAGSYNTTTANA